MLELFKWLFNRGKPISEINKPTRSKMPMSPKDPEDYTLTENSKVWEAEKYCPTCYHETTREERMADICNSCGTYNDTLISQASRSHRKIWDGENWVHQYKYASGDTYIMARPHEGKN